MTFYIEKMRVWNSFQTMWDQFQISTSMQKNLSFIVSRTLACTRVPVHVYTCIKHAHAWRPKLHVVQSSDLLASSFFSNNYQPFLFLLILLQLFIFSLTFQLPPSLYKNLLPLSHFFISYNLIVSFFPKFSHLFQWHLSPKPRKPLT